MEITLLYTLSKGPYFYRVSFSNSAVLSQFLMMIEVALRSDGRQLWVTPG